MVLGSMFLTIPTYGLMSALGLFQLYWQNNQLSTIPAPTVSWIISIFGFLTCFLDFPVGLVFDHWGTNVLLPVGCVLYWASFLSLAWASTYAHFFACFVAAGISACMYLHFPACTRAYTQMRPQEGPRLTSGPSQRYPQLLRFA